MKKWKSFYGKIFMDITSSLINNLPNLHEFLFILAPLIILDKYDYFITNIFSIYLVII